MRRRAELPAAKRPFTDLTAFHDAPYVLFTAGLTLGFMSSYVPFIYITTFAATLSALVPGKRNGVKASARTIATSSSASQRLRGRSPETSRPRNEGEPLTGSPPGRAPAAATRARPP